MITKKIPKEKAKPDKEKVALPNQSFIKVDYCGYTVYAMPSHTHDSVVLKFTEEINFNNQETSSPVYYPYEVLIPFYEIFGFDSKYYYANPTTFSGWFFIVQNEALSKAVEKTKMSLNRDFYLVEGMYV